MSYFSQYSTYSNGGVYIFSLKYLRDTSTSGTIAIGVVGKGHALVGGRVVEQVQGFGDDAVCVGAHQAHCAGGHGFGPFGGVTHHQHGFAQ